MASGLQAALGGVLGGAPPCCPRSALLLTKGISGQTGYVTCPGSPSWAVTGWHWNPHLLVPDLHPSPCRQLLSSPQRNPAQAVPRPRCSHQDTGRPGLRARAPPPREEGAQALRAVPGPRGSRRREPRLRGPGPFPIPGRTLALWMDTHGRGSDGDSPHHGRSVSDSASVNVLPVKTPRLMSRGERFWPHGQPLGSAHGQCLTSGWGGREGECV